MPTTLRALRGWVFVTIAPIALALTGACSSDSRSDVDRGASGPAASPLFPAPAASPSPRVRPAADLSAVVRHASLAFRSERGAFVAGTTTTSVAVEGSVLRVMPRAGVSARPPAAPLANPPALSLETSLVRRGEHTLVDSRGAPSTARSRLEADGSITLMHADVAERVENDDAGVEQSWRFDRAPSGTGDLVVHVRASGQRYAASTEHGLHFAAEGGGAGLRYGTATWVDANGRRTVVMPRFADGEIVMTVPDDVVARSAYPAVLDPTIAAEQEIDQPIAGSSAGGDQSSPSIASGGPGKGYLAVWFDRRGIRPAIYGARIASDGKIIDDTGIPIATSVGSTQPYIAASGSGYIVVWTVSYVDVYQPAGVYAVRLDADGKPLDTTPVAVLKNQTNAQQPSAAFDGSNWLIAWHRYAGGTTSNDIFAARLGKTGPVLDAAAITVSKETEPEYAPHVAFDGTDFLVMWRTSLAVNAQKFGKDGKPIGARLPLVAAGQSIYDVSAAFDGTRHTVVWTTYSPFTSTDVFARRFDKAGTPQDVAPLSISVDASYDERPAVAFDGTDFFITWARASTLLGVRMNTSGTVIDAPITLSTGTSSYYDYGLASDGAGSLVVNGEYVSPVGYDVKALKIAKPPVAGATPVLVSKAGNSETEPGVAWNGQSHFAAWIDSRKGFPAIWGTRIGAEGQPQPPVAIASDVKYLQLSRPRVASDGSGFLVVFYANDSSSNQRAVRGVYVDANGQPNAGGVFDITPINPNIFDYSEPDVSFDGANYLVVWAQRTNDGRSISGVRLPKGTEKPLETEPIRISALTLDEQRSSPSVGFDGTSYFVSWITSRPTASNIQVTHVYGTRVSKEGGVLDGETVVCDAFLLQRAPRVAGDLKKGGFFVAWEDFRTALETADVYGTRIGPKGDNLDGTSGMKIATGAHDESRPHVASAGDGSNWVVAWRDLRSKQTYDVYGAWISLAGKNHDPNGYLLSAESGDEEAPWLSASGGGKLLLAYERLDPRTGYGSYRLRARAIDSGAATATKCTKNEECASRSCVDGVCCGTTCGGCGVCNVQPGTCTPRAAGTETPTCERYKCKGAVECPNKCDTDGDCASNATCDPSTKQCVSRVICIDDHTLKDLTGKQTDCAPYKCTADACRTQCGSVDDCAAGFVCDYGGRCVQPPGSAEGGCSVANETRPAGSTILVVLAAALGAAIARQRRRATRT